MKAILFRPSQSVNNVSEDSGPNEGNNANQQSLAIALRHEAGTEDAPDVVASGRGKLAEKILELAFANDIKVREDADLAQLLTALDVGEKIPLEAFAAVSEILAYVYRASGEEPPESIATDFGLSPHPSATETPK